MLNALGKTMDKLAIVALSIVFALSLALAPYAAPLAAFAADAADGEAAVADATDALAESDTTQDSSQNAGAPGSVSGTTSGWGADGNYSDVYVMDLADIFTDSEYDELYERANALAEEYGMGVYLLMTDYMDGLMNPTSSQRTAYATGFYKRYGLGLGSGHDGIMLVVAVDSRDYVTVAYGQGSYSFSDGGIELMEDQVTEYLGDNEWYKGALKYYSQMSDQLAYYAKTGKPGVPLDIVDWIIRILIILLVPAVVAFFIVRSQMAAMKPVHEGDEAGDYLDRDSLVITAAEDTFINTTVAVTPKASKSGGDGGGGGWGGGGGGGFSSSGGGKF